MRALGKNTSMQANGPRGCKEMIGRALYSRVPLVIVYACVIVLVLSYVIVLVHTPMTIYAAAPHDDGLYIALGRYLSEGKWLGPFNQFTLMKGPGYPAFLALVHWLGVPISLAHAVFHCTAITFFVVVAHRFIGSLLLSLLLLALLLWHPISMTVFLLRVFRDEINYGQALILFAALLYALFYPSGSKQRNIFAMLGGAVLGWFWLTREDGAWIIPAMGLLLAVAAFRASGERRIRELVRTSLIFFGVFAATQIGFRGINRLVYGTFVGVDVKETNFERALGALASVRSGESRPFVTVTRAARERIYSVSPTLATLSGYLDTPPDIGWAKVTCDSIPPLCGEIGSGWFLWALRDAAAAAGHYQTPANASAFFGQIADEISAACAHRDLECSPQLIPFMPPVSWKQAIELLPSRLFRAYNLFIIPNPPLQLNPSNGTQDQLDESLRFLNHPMHTRSFQIPPAPRSYVLSGWYYKRGGEWVWMEVRGPDGSRVDVRIDRNPSPDLQQADPSALHQRFIITTRCNDDCVMHYEIPDGEKSDKLLAELRRAPIGFNVGEGRIHIDSADVREDPQTVKLRSEAICNVVRIAIVSHYSMVFLPVLVVGLVAFLVATFLRWRVVVFNMCYLIALTSWMLVILRAGLLILVDITSFPALDPSYLAPAYFFLVSGAVFSCAACLQLFVKVAGGCCSPRMTGRGHELP
jgi:hypothetical protein